MNRTILSLLICSAALMYAQENPSGYVGRYAMNDLFLIYVSEKDSSIALRPMFWTSVQPLRPVVPDSFVVADRPERGLRFRRDANGRVEGLYLTNIGQAGFYRRYSADEPHPGELLFTGKPAQSVTMLRKGGHTPEEMNELGSQLLRFSPSDPETAVRYFSILADLYPRNSAIHSRFGSALIASGTKSRQKAAAEFRKAAALDPSNDEATSALYRLGIATDTTGWRLPFSLSDLFAPVTAGEIRQVKDDWEKQDLSPRDVHVVFEGNMSLGYTGARVRIISHTVHGSRHYGAVVVPPGGGKKAVLLEAKGVSWDYFPLDVNRGILSPGILGPDQDRFIYLVPCFRGERLVFDGKEFLSEGDRRDGWDGATDDMLAFLEAALTMTPEADTSRIAVFGKSRGGSVALLAGIRQPRIKRVVDWVGPVDWFEAMGTEGWSQQELVKDGLRLQSGPGGVAGQFIERFLEKVIRGERGLRETRLHMIASSPLYFVKSLPLTQAHYGGKDGMVPVRNAVELERAMAAAGRGRLQMFLYQQAGHDLDNDLSIKRTREFLEGILDGTREKE